MKEGKTTGQLVIDYIKVIKSWLWLFRKYRLKRKYDNPSVDPARYTAKIYLAYLKLYNKNISKSISNKRKAVSKYENLIRISSKIYRMLGLN